MLVFGCDTNTRVGDLEAQEIAAGLRFATYRYADPAALRELERIAQEVEENLTQARWIAVDPTGNVRGDGNVEGDPFFEGLASHER